MRRVSRLTYQLGPNAENWQKYAKVTRLREHQPSGDKSSVMDYATGTIFLF